jgi:hypothetical protein
MMLSLLAVPWMVAGRPLHVVGCGSVVVVVGRVVVVVDDVVVVGRVVVVVDVVVVVGRVVVVVDDVVVVGRVVVVVDDVVVVTRVVDEVEVVVPVVRMSMLQPQENLGGAGSSAVALSKSSITYRLHVPFGSVPLKAAKATLPEGAGAGGGKPSRAANTSSSSSTGRHVPALIGRSAGSWLGA